MLYETGQGKLLIATTVPTPNASTASSDKTKLTHLNRHVSSASSIRVKKEPENGGLEHVCIGPLFGPFSLPGNETLSFLAIGDQKAKDLDFKTRCGEGASIPLSDFGGGALGVRMQHYTHVDGC